MLKKLASLSLLLVFVVGAFGQTAKGRVFVDSNGNRIFDPGEAVLRGVRVSNGIDITLTDRSGRWELPYSDDTIFFVVKPRDYMTPVDEHMLPKFYYIHKPAGSPTQRFPGVKPTGRLPDSIDFRAARALPSWQMNIIVPPAVKLEELGKAWVYVNVFGGSEKSKVEMKVGEKGTWTAMTKTVEPDPWYAKMVERDRALIAPYRPLPGAINSPHLWKLKLPIGLSKGTHAIHVRTTDMFGQTYFATRALRID